MNIYSKNQFNSINKKDLKVVFVDMDGTLLNTLPGLYNVYISFLMEFNRKGSIAEFNSLNGLILKDVVERLKTLHSLSHSVNSLEQRYRQGYLELYKTHPIPYPFAIETLQYLHGLGLKILLVTSASKKLVEIVLENPVLKDLIDEIVTGDSVIKGKPDPEIFNLALKRSHTKSHQAIVIEDAIHGVEAACAAGIYTIRHCPDSMQETRFHSGWCEVNSWLAIKKLFEREYA